MESVTFIIFCMSTEANWRKHQWKLVFLGTLKLSQVVFNLRVPENPGSCHTASLALFQAHPVELLQRNPLMLALTMPLGFCSRSTEVLALRFAALVFQKMLSVFPRNQAEVHRKETKIRLHSCRYQLSCSQLWVGWKQSTLPRVPSCLCKVTFQGQGERISNFSWAPLDQY